MLQLGLGSALSLGLLACQDAAGRGSAADPSPGPSPESPAAIMPNRDMAQAGPPVGGAAAMDPSSATPAPSESPIVVTAGAAAEAPAMPMGDEDGATAQTGPADGAALSALRAYLEQPSESRAPLAEQAFATTPLSAQGATDAQELLWADYAQQIRSEQADEFAAQRVVVDGVELRYLSAELNFSPDGERALFISMHGGGATDPATNDSQWRNQLALGSQYDPKNAIWVAPRAPTDDWNMWFKDHIPALFDRLITQFAVFAGIDTNHVYLTGYSAGGDGVYQLGPRMADRWAGAAMSAGHPNDASPLNLRNVPFAIHVGENDTAFERNRVAQQWADRIAALQADDPMGYEYQVGIHPGLGHWMELEDAVSIPFLQMRPRPPYPRRVVFRQDGELQPRLYNLAVDLNDVKKESTLVLEVAGQQVVLTEVDRVPRFRLRLSDALLDLDRPVQVMFQGRPLLEATFPRTIAVLHQSLIERGDPAQMFCAEVEVEVASL